MALLELEGETLGEKHRHYNKKLREHINQQTTPDHKLGDNDLDNLLKIDVASHNKDVDYILNVLKSDDMLCVSRALARSKWLVTDQEYANIINPDYLRTELFPNMTTKAMAKLKKHIRHNIKDEKRAENFYLNESNKDDALKWLPHCSVAFIESNIDSHKLQYVKKRLMKRLCEKSVSIFEIILKKSHSQWDVSKDCIFYLNTDADKYLDVLEKCKVICPMLGHKATKLIMKHCPKRVIENIRTYYLRIHIPTFVKYLKEDEIKNFLYAEVKQNRSSGLFVYDTLKHFIHRLPKDEQFDFAKKVYMSEISDNVKRMTTIECRNNNQNYIWYRFAPFEVAFEEITKLISQNADNNQKYNLLSLLIKCAKHNLQHVQTILKYFIDKHKTDNSSFKLQFVAEIVTNLDNSKYDETTWNILNELLASMDIYSEPSVLSSGNKNIVHFIIIYNALHDQKPPERVEKLFIFDTMKSHKAHLNQDQRNKLFVYLYNHFSSKLNDPITDKNSFTESITTVTRILKLLHDWDKTLLDYPSILDKIKQMSKLKKDYTWEDSSSSKPIKPRRIFCSPRVKNVYLREDSLSTWYNINKSWRKHMFEESIALCPSEEVCLNALKHDPKLLARQNEEVAALKAGDSVKLQRLQSKLRVYWPYSLAQQWIDEYSNKINETSTSGQKAAVLGICTMLTQKPLLDVIEKYKPDKAKIDWKHTDERVLNIQRLLAKNMHRGRPQPTPDAVLSYAKGDYLQFALPSLLAILYNLKHTTASQYIPKLLDTPVSLQKHGIRFAFKRLGQEDLKKVFSSSWKSSKNATIRAIIFKYTHTLLCNEKDDTKASSLWELLEIFIDNLTFSEDKEIYKTFSNVGAIPINVRANYIVKSYYFLQKLILNIVESDRLQYQNIINTLKEHSRVVMETISSDFVRSLIEEYIDTIFLTTPRLHHSDNFFRVISAYLLCSKTENDQIKKYENVFVPLMRRSLEKWGDKTDFYFVRQNFYQLLTCLSHDLKDYVVTKEMMIPLKMFTLIMSELEKSLSVPENYMILTKWKLTVALAKLTQEYPSTDNDDTIGFEFGKICLEYLKADVAAHFPCIYVLFSRCVKSFNMTRDATLKFFDGMLSDKDFVQAYLSCIEMDLQSYQRAPGYDELLKQISSHPSVEVKMHCSNKLTIDKKYIY